MSALYAALTHSGTLDPGGSSRDGAFRAACHRGDITSGTPMGPPERTHQVLIVGVPRGSPLPAGQVLGTVDVPTNRKLETNLSG